MGPSRNVGQQNGSCKSDKQSRIDKRKANFRNGNTQSSLEASLSTVSIDLALNNTKHEPVLIN